jgi:hypothetical protein
MLAIVEHKHHQLLRAERVRDTLGRNRPSGEFKSERRSNGDRYQPGVGQGPKLGNPDPVDRFCQEPARDLDA